MSAPVATVTPPRASSGRMPTLQIAWMLGRPGGQGFAALVLPAVAFAVTTALLLIVYAGTAMFWSWQVEDAEFYRGLSLLALFLLVIPLTSLGGAAARLSARRRDSRLATLRLLGATPAAVARVTVIESTGVALVGAVAGVLLYLAAMPLVGLVPFGGAPIGAGALWAGVPAVLLVIIAVAAVAAVSAAIGLRAVVISPLGVRTRRDVPRVRGLRMLVGAIVIIAAYTVINSAEDAASEAAMMAMMTAPFGVAIVVLNLIGPWAVERYARGRLRAATSPQSLLAARAILESPKAAWRQVAGTAMTSFVAVLGGAGMAMVDQSGGEDVIAADVRTGVLLTLVISFITVACSVGVSQAASILDRRDLWVHLDRAGMKRSTMESARAGQVLMPMVFVTVVSAGIGGVLALPAVGGAVVAAPLSLFYVVMSFVIGFAFVGLALLGSRAVLTRVLASPERT